MNGETSMIDRDRLEHMLTIAPFHQWLGLTVKHFEPGKLQLEMPWRDEIVSNPVIGSAHGGVLASLIDLSGLYVLLAMGHKAKATVDLRVDYHRPATQGPLLASATVVKVGRQISVADTRISALAARQARCLKPNPDEVHTPQIYSARCARCSDDRNDWKQRP